MVYRLGSGLQSAPDADIQQELSLPGQTGKDKAVLMIEGFLVFSILQRFNIPGHMQNPACGIK